MGTAVGQFGPGAGGFLFAVAGFIVIPRTPFVVTAGAHIRPLGGADHHPRGMVGSILGVPKPSRQALRPHGSAEAGATASFGSGCPRGRSCQVGASLRMHLGVPVPGSVQNFLFGLTSIGIFRRMRSPLWCSPVRKCSCSRIWALAVALHCWRIKPPASLLVRIGRVHARGHAAHLVAGEAHTPGQGHDAERLR